MQKASKIILGIDPGTLFMGFGLIVVEKNELRLLESGVLKPGRIRNNHKKLQLIFNTVSGLITKYQPTAFQHIGILSLEFHVDKLSRPLL